MFHPFYILIFSEGFGRCLVLDEAIQCTEKDECSYQEMMAFVPLNCHPCPQKVLIIGGGDGGVAREVLKHPLVQKIVQCEIDEAVIRVAKQYLPFMSKSFDDPKVELKIADGMKFVRESNERFDVIITDSSDPIGPAKSLFEKSYYESLYEALNPGGIICSQAENFWFELDIIKSLITTSREIFTSVAYGSTLVASYPSGQIGFLLASKGVKKDFSKPSYVFPENIQETLRYYSTEVHSGAFTLPKFVSEVCGSSVDVMINLIQALFLQELKKL